MASDYEFGADAPLPRDATLRTDPILTMDLALTAVPTSVSAGRW
jgi:hypothetical protein